MKMAFAAGALQVIGWAAFSFVTRSEQKQLGESER